jgi:hypothetical protein
MLALVSCQENHKQGCEAKSECFAAANFALQPSESTKDNFTALITPSEGSSLYLVMGPNQLINKIVKKQGVICL